MHTFRMLGVPFLAVVAGCAGKTATQSAPIAASPTPAASKPTEASIVGYFETRTHRITWLATDVGPRFIVADRQGAVLASNLTDAEVAQRFPELAEFARGVYAKYDTSARTQPILDASGPGDDRR